MTHGIDDQGHRSRSRSWARLMRLVRPRSRAVFSSYFGIYMYCVSRSATGSRDRESFDAVLLCSESKRLEITCPQQVRMGRKEDGGWDVCVAGPFNIVKPCLAYSIG